MRLGAPGQPPAQMPPIGAQVPGQQPAVPGAPPTTFGLPPMAPLRGPPPGQTGQGPPAGAFGIPPGVGGVGVGVGGVVGAVGGPQQGAPLAGPRIPGEGLDPTPDPLFICPRRPNIGTEGRPITLRANHFQITMPRGFLHHYDVTITPDKCPRKINRYVLFKIMNIWL